MFHLRKKISNGSEARQASWKVQPDRQKKEISQFAMGYFG